MTQHIHITPDTIKMSNVNSEEMLDIAFAQLKAALIKQWQSADDAALASNTDAQPFELHMSIVADDTQAIDFLIKCTPPRFSRSALN